MFLAGAVKVDAVFQDLHLDSICRRSRDGELYYKLVVLNVRIRYRIRCNFDSIFRHLDTPPWVNAVPMAVRGKPGDPVAESLAQTRVTQKIGDVGPGNSSRSTGTVALVVIVAVSSEATACR
jgi:hypothetical protein